MNKPHKIGDYTITKIEEQVIPGIPGAYLYPTATEADIAAGEKNLTAGDMDEDRQGFNVAVHAWLVQSPDRVILVDTASGNAKQRPNNPLFHNLDFPFLERLEAAGVKPEDVDYVLNTHLHVDHVGWNTFLKGSEWVPTFANARYFMPIKDHKYYASEESHNEVNIPSEGTFEDSVQPVIEAGLVDFIPEDGCKILDDFTWIPTPGHSIGHMSIALSSKGENAIFAGDVMHNPFQVSRPDLNTVFCEFLDDATISRHKILNHAADQNALYFGTHFPSTSVGRISRSGDGFSWKYE